MRCRPEQQDQEGQGPSQEAVRLTLCAHEAASPQATLDLLAWMRTKLLVLQGHTLERARDENCEIHSSISNFVVDISCILRFMGL